MIRLQLYLVKNLMSLKLCKENQEIQIKLYSWSKNILKKMDDSWFIEVEILPFLQSLQLEDLQWIFRYIYFHY